MFKTLNRRLSDAHKYHMAMHESPHENVLAFSVADSDYEVAPPIKQALRTRVEHGAFGYAKFNNTHRKAIRDWYKKRYDTSVKLNWILPVHKVLAGIGAALQTFTDPGDNVLIQTPVYHVFKPLIEDNARTVLENPLVRRNDAYAIDFEALENKLKESQAFIFCSPHNPVGRVWTHEEIKTVVDLCKKHDVFLISDEIHADIIIEAPTFTSLNEFTDVYPRMISVNAPSKTFNIAGLQSAYIIAHDQAVRETISKNLRGLHMSGFNILALKALLAAYNESASWVDAQNALIKKNKAMLDTFLEAHGLNSMRLEGTYLAWIDIFNTGVEATTFNKHLKKQGVVLSEGPPFGDSENRYVRMNLACSSEQLDEGLSRMAKVLESV